MVDGFSSADPSLHRDTVAGIAARRQMTSSRGGSSRATASVRINGQTVFINNQGFSVAPSLQAAFIQSRTGGVGASAQAAILQAQKIEEERKRQEQLRKAELDKLAKLKIDIARANISRAEKIKLINQVNDEKKAVEFQADIRSGKIQGFSGTGLSPSQSAKREFLLRTKTFKESSSKDNIFRNLDPLTSSYFLDTRPTNKDKVDLVRVLKSEQFNTARVLIPQEIISRGRKYVNNINNYIAAIRKDPNKATVLSLKIGNNRNLLVRGFKNFFGTRINNFTTRTATMLSLWITSSSIDVLTTTGEIVGHPIRSAKVAGGVAIVVGKVSLSVIKKTPKFVKDVAKNPKLYAKKGWEVKTSLQKKLISGGKIGAKLLWTETDVAVALIGREIFILVATGGAFTIIGKVGVAASRFSPFYKEIKSGIIVVRKVPAETFKVRGVTRFLAKRVQRPSLKRPLGSIADFLKGRKAGQFKKFTKDPGLVLETQTVKSGAATIAQQAKIAGTEITAVNAAADQLTTWLRRGVIIRKPIPSEASFSPKIRKLLKKFDKGKITFREFVSVNAYLRKNVAPHITLLERSMYFDPKSGLRLSRLGVQKERTATLRDIFKGNFKFFRNKPQITVIEKARVQGYPKYMKDIERKQLSGKTLTSKETERLLFFQKTRSGLLKPIGSTVYAGGTELEVTLAPKEFLKRLRSLGHTTVEGVKVSIVQAEIFQPSKSLLARFRMARLGKLTAKQLAKLKKFLSSKLGYRIKIILGKKKVLKIITKRKKLKSIKKQKKEFKEFKKDVRKVRRMKKKRATPVVRIKRIPRVLKRGKKKVTRRKITKKSTAKRKITRPKTTRKRITKKTTNRKTAKRTVRKKPIVRKPIKRIPLKRAATKRAATRKTARRTAIIPRLPKGFRRKSLNKKQQTYYVATRKRGKVIRLYPKPLTQKDARDYLAYSIDNNLTKTAWFVPLGKAKKVASPPKNIQGYFSKVKRKLRPYKIRQGRKKKLLNGYIEKRKFFQDTKGEVAQAKRLRRKLTASQKKILIQRLKKARAAKGRKRK